MGGETNLDVLVGSMSARLDKGLYVFATVPDRGVPDGVHPRMIFHEAEGVTLILLQEEAEAAGLTWEFPSRMITLGVHSSLEAVGFLARITTALAGQGMGVNPVSGFYHDHLFVPDGREQDAMAVLADMAKRSA
ncbi:ACT domain-containing protein (plasmid) [Rhodobacteraceae bacterium M382]|nr:ACT domain-containing protein [Rhodobacteraceae bacterium M382]